MLFTFFSMLTFYMRGAKAIMGKVDLAFIKAVVRDGTS